MSLLEEFQNRREQRPTEPAKKILFAILDDLFGRKGFDDEWDNIDRDIQEEILEENLEIVQANLP